MARLVLLVVIAAAAAVAAAWLADHPGAAVLRWEGWEARASVAVLALLAVLLAVAAALIALTGSWVRRGPVALARRRGQSRREQGYRALTDGFIAVAAGDARAARRLGRRAASLLRGSPLPLLIEAQSAQAGGDDAEARRLFSRMLDDPETEFLALRSLTAQARNAGDLDAALGYARRAQALRPKAPWVLNAIAELEAQAGHWRAAEAALGEAAQRKALPHDGLDRRRASLLTAEALEARRAGDAATALERARAAHRLAPGLAPTTAILAELDLAEGRIGAAAKAIEATWALAPHPDLARLYVAAESDALARLKRLERLVGRNPDHVESRLAVADAAIAAGLWGEARRWLRPLETGRTPARACRLMAAIELGENNDAAAARAWLERAAASGAPHPTWQCEACRAIRDSWSAACPSCGATGTLEWREFSFLVVDGLIAAPG